MAVDEREGAGTAVSLVRRLDHVAIAVRDTERAVEELSARLGLAVVHSEQLEQPPVRLTYLDAGNCYLQLVQPLNPDAEVATWLERHGEGVHHVCFGVESVPAALETIADGEAPGQLGSGRGRVSGFVPGEVLGMRLECTEFSYEEDVAQARGWLPE